MSTVNARFCFACEASPINSKNNIKTIKSITPEGSKTKYIFPEDSQLYTLHHELCQIPIVSRVLSQITIRGNIRNITVPMTPEVAALYLDEYNNAHFHGNFLAEADPTSSSITTASLPNPVPSEKVVSLKNLTKDMVIEKFTGKMQNAESWMSLFERECTRMDIPEHRHPEALRLFIDGPAVDWYAVALRLIGLGEPWTKWRRDFVESFGPKGWGEVASAYFYKYLRGSLSEYALRKIRLLLEVDPQMPVYTRINLVIIGLPPTIRDRIDRTSVETQNDLLSELNSLECYAEKLEPKNSSKSSPSDKSSRRQCSFCDKAGFPLRFHNSSSCWYNPDNPDNKLSSLPSKKDRPPPKNVKLINNVKLQEMLNEALPDQKNL